MNINGISAAAERAINKLKLSGFHQYIDNLRQEATGFNDIYLRLGKELDGIKADSNLSPEGRANRSKDTKEAALNKVKNIASHKQYDRVIADLEARLINNLAQAREKNMPKDEAAMYMMAREIRDYLTRLRVAQRAKVKEAVAEGTLLTDQKRSFDPVLAFFSQAISDYGPNKEPLLMAVTRPPYPIEILPPSVVEQGMAQLARNISPEIASQLDTSKAMKAAYNTLVEGVSEAVQSA